MGFLEKAKDVCRKWLFANPVYSARLVKKDKRGLPRTKRVELPKIKGVARDEPIAEIGDYEIVSPIWRFKRKKK